MMLCDACGYENRAGARFCKNCGSQLSQSVATPPPDPILTENTDANATLTPVSAPPLTDFAVDNGSTTAALPSVTADAGETPGAAQALDSVATDLPVLDHPTDHHTDGEPTPAGDANPNSAPGSELLFADEAEAAPTDDDGISAPLNQPPMLAVGEVIADRYWVTAHSQNEAGETLYQVEDHGVCRACGATVSASEEEQYCFECGAHLFDATLPWPTLQLRLVPPELAATTEPFLVWQDYLFVKQVDTEAAPAVASFDHGVNLLVGQRSDVGLLRHDRPDEDSIFTLTLSSIYESQARPTMGLYLVADGMGGHGDGEVASRLAVETISVYLLQMLVLPTLQFGPPATELITRHLDEAIQLANRRILEQAQAKRNEMGTTVTLAFVLNDIAYVANVGDSRTYLWHGQGLQQISEDHSAVYQLVKRGLLTQEEIYTHPRRNEILRSLGMTAPVRIDQFQMQLAPGNLLLLCCDGLWEMTRNEGIEEVLLQNFQDPQLVCDELIRLANKAGGEDNISVVVVRVLA